MKRARKKEKEEEEKEALVDSFYTKQWEWEIALVWNYGLLFFFPCLALYIDQGQGQGR